MQNMRSFRRGSKVVWEALLTATGRTFTTSTYRPQEVLYTEPGDMSSAAISSSNKTSSRYPQTLTEKIVQRHSLGLPKGKFVKAGDYTRLSPSYIMTHDNSWPVALKFMSLGASKVHDKNQLVMTLDHDVQNQNEANLKKYRQIEEFAKAHNVDFYPAGRGIGHQIMVEEGYAWPGTLAVASDSHSNMYGGIGCLGTPVVRTDAASIWATGWTWFQLPPQARVTFTGSLPKGVTGKDIIVALCGLFSRDEVLNHAIEFSGSEETLKTIPVDARLTLSNMSTEWGALSGIFPVDGVLIEWLRFKATKAALYRSYELTDEESHPRLTHQRIDELVQHPILADKGAKYQKELYLDLSTLCPYVSGPNSVKVATPLNQLKSQNIKIDKAYLVSCTNSRASDIAAAASVFREASKNNAGKIPKIADHVQFYISAASSSEQEEAEEANDWQTLVEAGAIPLTSGCGPCIGLGRGILESGEVGISASNRNFKGRMGSTEALAYLGSPEVVAASALRGKITGPDFYKAPEAWSGVVCGEGDGKVLTVEEALEKGISQLDSIIEAAEKDIHGSSAMAEKDEEQLTDILPGFPEKIEGELIFCDADNLNTDSIYPGKYTYQDNVTPEKMADVCMSNYDASFSSIVQENDILLSGFNFGCGSSREQAATAILATKIPLVVAGSFGNIFSRNSINNALPNLELPDLVELLRKRFSSRINDVDDKKEITEPQANRESLDSPPPAPVKVSAKERMLTRRTGLHLRWDVRKSLVEVLDEKKDIIFRKKVGEMPPNVQEIIACGGLENRVKQELEKEKI